MGGLVGIHKNVQSQLSVDIFNERHAGVSKWRLYFTVTPATVARLRRLYRADKTRFIITGEWSAGRWRAYKQWRMGRADDWRPRGLLH